MPNKTLKIVERKAKKNFLKLSNKRLKGKEDKKAKVLMQGL